MTISRPVPLTGAFSEWQSDEGHTHPHYVGIADAARLLGPDGLSSRWSAAQKQVDLDAFTFSLDPKKYRPTPADWIPRVIPADQWRVIADGVEQRIRAINRFLVDLYDDQQDIVPNDVVFTSQYFYPEIQGFRPPGDVFVHIYGIDLVHMGDGRYVVLEDNLRIPSGISYQIKTVDTVSRLIPEFSEGYDVVPYDIRETYLGMFRSLCDTESPKTLRCS